MPEFVSYLCHSHAYAASIRRQTTWSRRKFSLAAISVGRYGHMRKKWEANPSCSPGDVENPYLSLGTRADVVEWVWNHMHGKVPSSRRWVVMGTPALVNPDSEIVFAFAAGTGYALRLPEDTRQQAIAANAKHSIGKLDLSVVGDEWVVGMGRKDNEEWWRSAFGYSARTK